MSKTCNTCAIGAGYDRCQRHFPPLQFGILGILVTAKQRKLIPQVQPLMDALIHQAGFRVSPQLYQRVLNLANES